MIAPSKRRWFRFSLRTMFVVGTVFCVFFGFQVHLVRERRAFIATESALLTLHGMRNLTDDFKMHGVSAPWPFGFFGEERQRCMEVYAEGADFAHMTANDWEKANNAMRLLPEAEIYFCHEVDNTINGWTVNASR